MHLIEVIFSLAILCCGYVAIPAWQNFKFLYYANANFAQIKAALNYARSLSVKEQKRVLLCPSHDMRHCSENWQNGILVASHKQRHYFHLLKTKDHSLTLSQSGFTTQKMTIEGNGLTNYNGCFNYTSRNHNEARQFKLYFNKALRVYILKGE